jgi:hypothetical protein
MVLTHYEKDFLDLVGKTVKEVRHMSPDEIEQFGWYEDYKETTMIIFTDKTAAILSQDPEGNGPGFMFIGQMVAV